jgi:hypothetical protein
LDVDRRRHTLQAIFEKRANIPWSEIERMLAHLGASDDP